MTDSASKEQYDEKGNAKHYDSDRINGIVMMERIWGTKAVMLWCEITAFKYRMRIGRKEGQPVEQDLLKTSWYEKMAKILEAKIGTSEEVMELPPDKCKNPFR